MKNVKQYYKELGKIIYSIAIADGIIQIEEREKLREMVIKELAQNERSHDSSGMNQAFYVDFEFAENSTEKPYQEAAVERFTDFIDSNLESHDEALISISLKLMESVANACSKTPESKTKEKEIIRRIKNSTDLLFTNVKK